MLEEARTVEPSRLTMREAWRLLVAYRGLNLTRKEAWWPEVLTVLKRLELDLEVSLTQMKVTRRRLGLSTSSS